MKIIYGVSGEGRGHSSRSKVLIDYLVSKGHEVKIFSYKKGFDYLSKYFKDVHDIFGLELEYNKQEIDLVKTIGTNIKNLSSKFLGSFKTLFEEMNSFKPDFIISDFEPLTVSFGRVYGIKCLSVNHQNVLNCCNLEYPVSWQTEFLKTFAIVENYHLTPDKLISTTFYFPSIRGKYNSKFSLIGPILRPEVFKVEKKEDDFILVYTSNKENLDLLARLSLIDENFIVYGSSVKAKFSNIEFKNPSTKGFLEDLARCKAVVTNGGYSLMSESLFLGKPVYSLPLNGQFEQMLNAYYLEKMQYGMYDLEFSEKRFLKFLKGIDFFKLNIEEDSKLFCGNEQLIEEVDKFVETLKE
jgi:uncharacterized protein (TIGR00661 family)